MSGVGPAGAVVIGLLAGWLAGLMVNRQHGLLTNLAVGLVGSLIGSFIARAMDIAWAGWIGSLVISALGAVVLLALLSLVRRP